MIFYHILGEEYRRYAERTKRLIPGIFGAHKRKLSALQPGVRQKLELSLTTGRVAKASFRLPCDNQTGREGFAEKTGAVDRGDGDERAKSGKL